MENLYRKCAPKTSPRTLFQFWQIAQNSQSMQKTPLKIRNFERGL